MASKYRQMVLHMEYIKRKNPYLYTYLHIHIRNHRKNKCYLLKYHHFNLPRPFPFIVSSPFNTVTKRKSDWARVKRSDVILLMYLEIYKVQIRLFCSPFQIFRLQCSWFHTESSSPFSVLWPIQWSQNAPRKGKIIIEEKHNNYPKLFSLQTNSLLSLSHTAVHKQIFPLHWGIIISSIVDMLALPSNKVI